MKQKNGEKVEPHLKWQVRRRQQVEIQRRKKAKHFFPSSATARSFLPPSSSAFQNPKNSKSFCVRKMIFQGNSPTFRWVLDLKVLSFLFLLVCLAAPEDGRKENEMRLKCFESKIMMHFAFYFSAFSQRPNTAFD